MKVRQTITHLPVEVLAAHSSNVRNDIGDVAELACSIAEHGILQPLTVTEHPTLSDRYLVLAGHRRLAAGLRAGLLTVPCVIRHGLADESEQLIVMLVENCQRHDLSAVEKAEAYGALRNRGLSIPQISRRVGIAVPTVSYYLTLLELDESSLDRVRSGEVNVTTAVQAVRGVRRDRRTRAGGPQLGRPVVAEKPHLSVHHPLAADVRQECEHTTRPKVGKVGCGQCWEQVIRQDALGLTEDSPASDDYDEAAVIRALNGDRGVRLRKADRIEIVRRGRARGWSLPYIEANTPITKPERYLSVVDGEAS